MPIRWVTSRSVPARSKVPFRYFIVSGSAFIAAYGPMPDARQHRRANRSVRTPGTVIEELLRRPPGPVHLRCELLVRGGREHRRVVVHGVVQLGEGSGSGPLRRRARNVSAASNPTAESSKTSRRSVPPPSLGCLARLGLAGL